MGRGGGVGGGVGGGAEEVGGCGTVGGGGEIFLVVSGSVWCVISGGSLVLFVHDNAC